MKPLTPNMRALLDFIQTRHAETGQPVTQQEVALAAPIPSRHRCAATVGLLDRGLIDVPTRGVPAWLPVVTS